MKKSEKKFDKAEYDRQYHKDNYYRMSIVMSKDLRKKIEEEAEKSGESKNGYVVKAIQSRLGE